MGKGELDYLTIEVSGILPPPASQQGPLSPGVVQDSDAMAALHEP